MSEQTPTYLRMEKGPGPMDPVSLDVSGKSTDLAILLVASMISNPDLYKVIKNAVMTMEHMKDDLPKVRTVKIK